MNQQRLGVAMIIVSTCAINVLSLALPVATLQIYDRLLPSQNIGTLRMLVAGVLVALAIETLLRICRSYIITQRGAAFVHRTSYSAVRTQLDSKRADAGDHTVSADIANMTAIKSLKDFKSGAAAVTLIDLLFLPIYVGVMAYISQHLVLVPLILLCGFAIFTAFNGLVVRRHLENSNDCDERRYGFLIDSLSSSELMKAFALEKRLQRRFEAYHARSCLANYSLSKSISQSFVYSTVLSSLLTASTVTYGAYMVVDGDLTVGALIAVILLANRLMVPVQKAVLLWLRFQEYQSATARTNSLISEPVLKLENTPFIAREGGSINVSRIAFRKTPTSPLILDEISFSLSSGEALLLDGKAGSGRTALLKIIAGIYSPTSGKVEINGLDPTRVSSDQLARQIGYLSSRSKLFRGTIRDNITRFSDVPSSQALEVAALLGLSDEIARLPLGIDTVVGTENETSLAPGLIQMLTVLRVLAPKPRILLFDDADCGLDTKHYASFCSLLGKLKRHTAMIIVSNDQNIRKLGDRRAFLSESHFVEANDGNVSVSYQTRL